MRPAIQKPVKLPMIKNSLFVFVSRGIDFISGFVIIIIAARYLGVSAFGDYAFVRTVEITLAHLIAFGTTRIIIRDSSVSRDKTSGFLACGIVINTVMGVAVSVIAALIGYAYELPPDTMLSLLIAVAAQYIWRITDNFNAAFIAHEKMSLHMVVTMMVKTLTIVFVSATWYFDLKISGFFISFAVANALGLAVALHIYICHIPRTPWAFSMAQLTYIVRQSLPMSVATFFTMAYNHSGVFFLKSLQSNSQVSFFQMPQRLLLLLTLYPASFLLSVVPLISRLGSQEESRSELKYIIETIWKYLLILVLPVCAISMSPLLETGIRLVIGPGFVESAASCRILIWLIPLFLGNVLMGEILVSIKKQQMLIACEGICLIVNLILCPLLVPRFGHQGASWALLLSCAVLFICQYYCVSSCFFKLNLITTAIKLGLATGIMSGIIILGKPGIMIPLLTGSAAYVIIIVLTRLSRWEEMTRIKAIVHNDLIKTNNTKRT